jgi:hypothetical protein
MRVRNTLFVVLLMLWAVPAFSQGCVMCYSSAAALPKDGQRAVNKGVLVLLVPPVGLMTVGGWLAFRYSQNRDHELS